MHGLRDAMRAFELTRRRQTRFAIALLTGRRDAVGIAAQGRSDAAMLNAVTVFGLTLGR